MWPSKKEIDMIKAKYPEGTRIRLIHMNDSNPISPGTEGSVDYVDDAGHIQMKWDDGRRIALMEKEDQFEIISHEHDKEVIYVDKKRKSVFEALRKADAEFHIGELKEQYMGEDVSYHASPMYETITIIQDGDQVYHHTDYETRYQPNPIEYVKVSELQLLKSAAIERIHEEIEELEKQIQMKKQEIENVQNNSKVISQMLDEASQVMEETPFTMQMK